jgi:RNA polymerase sigma factor (sigma-70 family)
MTVISPPLALSRWSPELGYPRPVPETTLEERFVRGDEAALRAAFEAHGALVHTLCRRLVGDDAEALTHRFLLVSGRGPHGFDPSRGSLASWLAGISRFKAIDHLRARGRRVVLVSEDHGAPAMVESRVDEVADRLIVNLALSDLPPERRHVLELAFFEDLSHGDIAARTGLPLGTVKSHVRRGLASLKAALEGSHVEG